MMAAKDANIVQKFVFSLDRMKATDEKRLGRD